MESRSLIYFIAVAEAKNLGRAAARLHITQPALSRQIQSLEEELDVSLFIRTVAGMELTSSGIALLQHARNIRSELELAKKNAQRAQKKEQQKLDVGVYGSAIFAILPRLFSLFSQFFPDIELALHSVPKQYQIESLRRGEIQIMFDRLLPEEPGLIQEVVYLETVYLALPQNHRLAQCESVKRHELKDEVFIWGTDGKSVARLAKMLGFNPNIGGSGDSYVTAVAMVGSGFGVVLAPQSCLSMQIPNIVYRPLADAPELTISLQCMYRENDRTPQLQSLLEVIRTFRVSQISG